MEENVIRIVHYFLSIQTIIKRYEALNNIIYLFIEPTNIIKVAKFRKRIPVEVNMVILVILTFYV